MIKHFSVVTHCLPPTNIKNVRIVLQKWHVVDVDVDVDDVDDVEIGILRYTLSVCILIC